MAIELPLADRRPAARLDNQDEALFGQTPSQTVGPFFHYGLPWHGGADLVGASRWGSRPDLFDERHDLLNLSSPSGTPVGEVIELHGRVFDAEGSAVPDAMIEIWQANAAGRYRSLADERDDVPVDPHFVGFGRAAVDCEGRYRFRTIMPGRAPGPGDGLQSAHVAMSVFGRGLLKRLATRVYFAGGYGLEQDAVLAAVPTDRHQTLIAAHDGDGQWRFDIRLGGPDETVFFDL